MDVVFEYKGWRFEWDAEKAAKNLRDHGVTFEHAAKAFRDGESLMDPDYMHSRSEERWVDLGLYEGRLLTVCLTWRETGRGETSYRIISAHELSTNNVQGYRRRHLKRS